MMLSAPTNFAMVRSIESKVTIELRDLDRLTTDEEVTP